MLIRSASSSSAAPGCAAAVASQDLTHTRDVSVTSFTLERAMPKMDFSFTSNAVSIPAILATCQQCFERLPVVHVLAIRGFEFELAMGLTPAAQQNLDDAMAYLSMPSEH